MKGFQADRARGRKGRKRRAAIGVLATAMLASVLGLAPAAHAAIFTAACDEESLIDRIEATNNVAGPDTLYLAKNCTYEFEEAYFDEVGMVLTDNALPAIDDDLTIVGRGAKIVRDVDEDDAEDELFSPFRLLEVDFGNIVVINDVTFAGGLIAIPGLPSSTSVDGGGILNFGDLTLNRVTVKDNEVFFFGATTSGPSGGGIASTGPLTLNRSTVSGNEITGIATNSVNGLGGGIYGTGLVRIGKSTVKNNEVIATAGAPLSLSGAGGIYVNGSLVMSSSSVTGNTVDSVASGASHVSFAGGIGLDVSTSDNVINKSNISGNRVEAEGGQLTVAAGGGILNLSTAVVNDWGLSVDDPDLGAADDDQTKITDNKVSCEGLCQALGGGYANSPLGTFGTAEFNHTLFKGNVASASDGVALGGGLYLDGDGVAGTIETSLQEATVTKNTAKGDVLQAGGGIYATPDAEVDLDDSRVFKNKPDDCAGAALFGLCDD